MDPLKEILNDVMNNEQHKRTDCNCLKCQMERTKIATSILDFMVIMANQGYTFEEIKDAHNKALDTLIKWIEISEQ